ncbi:Conserved_hypothetical protein [Hexamita inflata]|uniref:Uncharacterized protein n=1 Tax=Hexamita inflata TaxID=28002 RepID=A0AA86QXU5_9EUKA|nr:Conserved hypothetical protein [Hexamita inflata]
MSLLTSQTFAEAFVKVISKKTDILFVNTNEAHKEYLLRQNGAKFDIWKNMSQTLNISAKKIHDYYHNTWSKQFYDNIAEYRDEIKKLVQSSYSQFGIQETVKSVIEQLKQQFPELNLHFQTVYQYVNYQVKNKCKTQFKRPNKQYQCERNGVGTQHNQNSEVSEPVFYFKFNVFEDETLKTGELTNSVSAEPIEETSPVLDFDSL